MREKALATISGPAYRLWEVKWGALPVRRGARRRP